MTKSAGIGEPRWHPVTAVIVALILYTTLPPKLVVGPLWLLPMLVLATLGPLLILAPHRLFFDKWQRILSVGHIAVLSAFNLATVALLCLQEVSSTHRNPAFSGETLLIAAVQIWLTNILVYGLWYWEVDAGGPRARAAATPDECLRRASFLFPQMTLRPELASMGRWRPKFFDYLFVAFNTATAFSPTDTYPLTPLAKGLMMAESVVALVTIAIVAGRAVNILGG